MEFQGPKRAKILKQIAITVVILAVLFAMVIRSREISFAEVFTHLGAFTPAQLLLALLAAVLQFFCLGIRLFTLLPNHPKLSFRPILTLNSYGQVMNHWLPVRSGDVFKVFALRRAGKEAKLKTPKILAALTIDRVAQIFSLLVLLLILNFENLSEQFVRMTSAKSLALVSAISLVSIVLIIFRKRLLQPVRDFFRSSKEMIFSRAFLWALAFSTAAWVFECASLMILAKALNITLPLSQAFFVLLIVNLGIAVPLSFANLGTYEAAIVFALTQLGVGMSKSLAVGISHHLAQALAVVVLALIFFGISRLQNCRIDTNSKVSV